MSDNPSVRNRALQGIVGNIIRRILTEVAVISSAAVLLIVGYYCALLWRDRNKITVASPASTQAALTRIADRAEIVAGSHVEFGTAAGSDSSYSFVLAVSPSCHFCVDSAPFYRRLAAEARRAGFPLRIAVPRSEATAYFISAAGLGETPAVDWDSLDGRFRVTPSLALLGPDHTVKRVWIGELRSPGEEEVLAAIHAPSRVQQPKRRLESGEIVLAPDEVHSQGDAVVVSTVERERFEKWRVPGSINIPLKELLQRADRDLKRDLLTVIDCSGMDDKVCAVTLSYLRKDGFRTAAADFSGSDHMVSNR